MLPLQWSFAGPVPELSCLQINEPADPDTWSDNYLCSSQDLGFAWSSTGPITGLHCVAIQESVDPDGWGDNYLCSTADFEMEWSSAGPLPGRSCLQINEPADPHTWNDNYLCFKRQVCEPTRHTLNSDAALSFGPQPVGGLSVNVVAGPRDCGGRRISRSVTKLNGTGDCSVVDGGDIFWANELCARNDHLVVGNSDIGDACNAFRDGGSDLGDHDCRYIVHAGASPSIEGLGCQPSHVTRVLTGCR